MAAAGKIAGNLRDSLVLFNALILGLEIDAPYILGDALHLTFRVVIPVAYMAEMAFEFSQGSFATSWRLRFEALVVLVSTIGAFSSIPILWRCSGFKLARLLRFRDYAKNFIALGDLWLVLASWRAGVPVLGWFILILGLLLLVFGIAAQGFVYAGPDDWELTTEECGGFNDVHLGTYDFRRHIYCIDVDEYFGNMLRSTFTMFQMLTMDRWAAHVVRPLSGIRPLAAGFIVVIVVFMAYGLMSIFLGLLVWCTVETATHHDAHRANIDIVLDRVRVQELTQYFSEAIALEAKETLDFREMKESLSTGMPKIIYTDLRLPVDDLEELWTHLTPNRESEITMEQWQERCMSLLNPVDRMDMAHLSCKLNGRGEFVKTLGKRAEVMEHQVDDIFKKLSLGFKLLRKHVQSPDLNEVFPEVGLRRAGKMRIPEPVDDD